MAGPDRENPLMRSRGIARHLDGLKFGKMHRKVWILSAFGIMLDGFDFFIMGVAIPLIVKDFGANPFQVGLASSAAIIGAIVGAAVMGPLSDRIGRSLAFKIDLAMFVVFALLSAIAPDIWWLIVFRFFLGVGIGADYPIASSYVAEIAPGRLRSRLLIGAFSFQAVGQLLGALVGLGILLLDPAPEAWRWMLAFGVVPAIIIVFLRRNVPESPMWLVETEKYEEAATALTTFTGEIVTVEEVRKVTEEEAVVGVESPADERAAPGTKRTLFSRGMRGATALTSVPWFLMDIATYGVGVFTPTILAALALGSSANTNFIADDIVSTTGAAFLDLFLIVGFAAALVFVRKLGLITMQTAGFLIMAVSLLVLGVTSFMVEGSQLQLVVIFVAFAAFNLFMNAGPNSTTFALPAVAFPTSVRGAGAGFAAASGKVGAAVGVFFFPMLHAALGLFWTLTFISIGCFIAAIITIAFRKRATDNMMEERTVVVDPAAQGSGLAPA
jgi:MFS family permease